MLDVVVIQRGRTGWEWQVRDQIGTVILCGRQKDRRAARYYGYRALLLLLAAGWKSTDFDDPKVGRDR